MPESKGRLPQRQGQVRQTDSGLQQNQEYEDKSNTAKARRQESHSDDMPDEQR